VAGFQGEKEGSSIHFADLLRRNWSGRTSALRVSGERTSWRHDSQPSSQQAAGVPADLI